jgi:hypothetical protein
MTKKQIMMTLGDGLKVGTNLLTAPTRALYGGKPIGDYSSSIGNKVGKPITDAYDSVNKVVAPMALNAAGAALSGGSVTNAGSMIQDIGTNVNKEITAEQPAKFKKGGKLNKTMYKKGGELLPFDKNDLEKETENLIHYDGNSHAEGGVPTPVGEFDKKETVLKENVVGNNQPFAFSDNNKLTKQVLNLVNLPNNYKDLTIAEASKKIESKYAEKHNDDDMKKKSKDLMKQELFVNLMKANELSRLTPTNKDGEKSFMEKNQYQGGGKVKYSPESQALLDEINAMPLNENPKFNKQEGKLIEAENKRIASVKRNFPELLKKQKEAEQRLTIAPKENKESQQERVWDAEWNVRRAKEDLKPQYKEQTRNPKYEERRIGIFDPQKDTVEYLSKFDDPEKDKPKYFQSLSSSNQDRVLRNSLERRETYINEKNLNTYESKPTQKTYDVPTPGRERRKFNDLEEDERNNRLDKYPEVSDFEDFKYQFDSKNKDYDTELQELTTKYLNDKQYKKLKPEEAKQKAEQDLSQKEEYRYRYTNDFDAKGMFERYKKDYALKFPPSRDTTTSTTDKRNMSVDRSLLPESNQKKVQENVSKQQSLPEQSIPQTVSAQTTLPVINKPVIQQPIIETPVVQTKQKIELPQKIDSIKAQQFPIKQTVKNNYAVPQEKSNTTQLISPNKQESAKSVLNSEPIIEEQKPPSESTIDTGKGMYTDLLNSKFNPFNKENLKNKIKLNNYANSNLQPTENKNLNVEPNYYANNPLTAAVQNSENKTKNSPIYNFYANLDLPREATKTIDYTGSKYAEPQTINNKFKQINSSFKFNTPEPTDADLQNVPDVVEQSVINKQPVTSTSTPSSFTQNSTTPNTFNLFNKENLGLGIKAAATLTNLASTFKKPQTIPTQYNEYQNQIKDIMNRRKIDLTPQTNNIQKEKLAALDRNTSNSWNVQNALNQNTYNSTIEGLNNINMKQQEANNTYGAQNAETLNNLGQQNVTARNYAEEINAKTLAARNNAFREGISNIADAGNYVMERGVKEKESQDKANLTQSYVKMLADKHADMGGGISFETFYNEQRKKNPALPEYSSAVKLITVK